LAGRLPKIGKGFPETAPEILFLLLRRAGNCAIGAEHAAIPLLRLKTAAAMDTFVEKPTGIGGHGFFFLETAMRAFDNGF
jgi:hypothetical protein